MTVRKLLVAGAALAALALAAAVRPAAAGDITYPNLNPATTVQDTDLLATWRASGPLTKVQASVLNAYIQGKLNPVYLQIGNSLSELSSTAATARMNLGLGSAATQNTGTSGNVLCLLNANCIKSGTEQFNAQVTFDAQVNLAAPIVPSGGNGIQGTTAGDNANAGIVGEYLSNSAQSVPYTTGTANIVSLTLTPGDWDVSGEVSTSASTATITSIAAGVSTTSGSFFTYSPGVNAVGQLIGISTTAAPNVPAPRVRVNVSASTTVYLVVACAFSGGTMSMNGFIQARRVR